MDHKQVLSTLEQDQQAVEMDQMAEDELVLSLSGSISNKEWQE